MPSRSKPAVVLIVEDETLVRMDAADMFASKGYEVIEASTADDAIRILEQRSDISLVFTDINMPGSTDGMRLAAAVRDRWPPVRIIVTSGHKRESELAGMPQGGRFLGKPYTTEQVIGLTRQVLGA